MTMSQWLIPVKKYKTVGGLFDFEDGIAIAGAKSCDAVGLGILSKQLGSLGIYCKKTQRCNDQGSHVFMQDCFVPHQQGYELLVFKNRIVIKSSSSCGRYYAVQTLCELIKKYGKKIPCCKIQDWPDFERRGIYLDCSRGKVPKLQTLKKLVELLSQWKINELQLYIENVFKFAKHPKIGRGYSPFTASELLKLQKHCQKHHVNLVGSLASFGHMERILSIPDYRYLSEVRDIPQSRHAPFGTTLCPTDPGSIKLIKDLYSEFLPLFEADDFNICCDETHELGKGRTKRKAAIYGVGKVYLDFLKKIFRLCDKYGKRPNFWTDIALEHPELLGEIPKDVVMINWEYGADGERIKRCREIAEKNIPFMGCCGTTSWLSHGTHMYNSMPNVSGLTKEAKNCGAVGMLNSDWGDLGHRNTLGVSLHSFAHSAAHFWNGKDVDDAQFTKIFCKQVFRQKNNKLADSLKKLGSTSKYCQGLYHLLVEPFDKNNDFYSNLPPASPAIFPPESPWVLGSIDESKINNLNKIITRLSSIKEVFEMPVDLEDFLLTATKEFSLACEMDILSAGRIKAIKDYRSGRKVSKRTLMKLVDDYQKMARNFEVLWLDRNKYSRLKDNMSLFERALKEKLKLIKG